MSRLNDPVLLTQVMLCISVLWYKEGAIINIAWCILWNIADLTVTLYDQHCVCVSIGGRYWPTFHSVWPRTVIIIPVLPVNNCIMIIVTLCPVILMTKIEHVYVIVNTDLIIDYWAIGDGGNCGLDLIAGNAIVNWRYCVLLLLAWQFMTLYLLMWWTTVNDCWLLLLKAVVTIEILLYYVKQTICILMY